MKLIPVHRHGAVVAHAKVDDCDYERLSLFSWTLGKGGYARRSFASIDRKVITVPMHRQVLGLQHREPFYGDHINRDRLDNRRENLRICTPQESAQHRGPGANSGSRFRGVYAVGGKWIARVRLGPRFDNVIHNLGTYEDEEEAARVAAEFRREHMPFSVEELAP